MLKGKSLLVLLTISAITTSLRAAEVDISLGADIFDKYIWRGQSYGNRPVIQPSATIGKDGASLNVWGNMPLLDNDPAGRNWNFNELDYTLDYSGAAGIVNYSAGFILYTFPTPASAASLNTTHEIYGSVGFDTLLSPTITAYKDIKQAGGYYVNLGIGHSLSLTEKLGLDLGATLAWGSKKYNDFYWAAGTGDGINDLVLSSALPFDVGGVTLVPSLSYVTLVDSSVRQNNGYSGHSDFWILGIGTSIDF